MALHRLVWSVGVLVSEICVPSLLGRMRIYFRILISMDSVLWLSSTGAIVWMFTCSFLNLSREMERLGTRGRGV